MCSTWSMPLPCPPAYLRERAGALVRQGEVEVQARGQAVQRAPVELARALHARARHRLRLRACMTVGTWDFWCMVAEACSELTIEHLHEQHGPDWKG